MARFSWLHLSDLHLGRTSRLLRSNYREAFELDLRRMHERSGPWDFVIISGDVTAGGAERDFAVATSTLESLWAYLHSLGSQPCLLAIPGDLDCQIGQLPQPPVLGTRSNWKKSNAILGSLTKGLSSFSQWFTSWRTSHPSTVAFSEGLLPGDFAATLAKRDSKVGVLGLNTVLLRAPGVRELDLEQVLAATGEDVREWALQHDLLLLVTQYAPRWLNPSSLKQLLTELVPSGRPFVHLCGSHTHFWNKDNLASVILRSAPRGICIQAPNS